MQCLLFAISLSMCKEPDIVVDETAPVIEVREPVRNQVFAPGDTVFIRASIADDRALWKAGIHIHNPDTVFNYKVALETATVELDTFWIVNDADDRSYTIYVDGYDKAENLSQSVRAFHLRH
jgi:hypothetical protein